MTEQNELKLAFLETSLFEDGAVIRGAALVTDAETRPLEFRCTSSIRPTSLQRVLYGDTLDEYIAIELVGLPLLKAAKEKPSLVLVNNPLFVKMRPIVQYPIVLISHDSKTTFTQDIASDIKSVSISSHKDFASETSVAQQMLTTLMLKRNLLEPFERVRAALSDAHRQKIGDVPSGGTRA